MTNNGLDLALAQECTKSNDPNGSMTSLPLINVNDFSYVQKRQKYFYPELPKKPKLSLRINKFLYKHNIGIIIGNQMTTCKKDVLMFKFPVFADLHREKVIRLPATEISIEGFDAVYKWVQAGPPELNHKNILEIYRAARYFRIKPIVQHCWMHFDDYEHCSEDIAFKLFVQAEAFEEVQLKKLFLTRISKYFLTMVASRTFLEFNAEQVIELLQLKNMAVNNEMEIFMICVHWLSCNWPDRSKHLMSLMECVHFERVPVIFIHYIRRPIHSISSSRTNKVLYAIAMDDVLYKRIYKACAHLTDSAGANGDLNKSLERRKVLHQRRWIYDLNCPYHYDIRFPRNQAISYDDFLDYLIFLRRKPETYCESIFYLKDMQRIKTRSVSK